MSTMAANAAHVNHLSEWPFIIKYNPTMNRSVDQLTLKQKNLLEACRLARAFIDRRFAVHAAVAQNISILEFVSLYSDN